MRTRSGFMGNTEIPLQQLGQSRMTLSYPQAKAWAEEFRVMVAAHPECASRLTKMISDIVDVWDQRLAYLSPTQAIERQGTWSIDLTAEDVSDYQAFKVCSGQAPGAFPSWGIPLAGAAAAALLIYSVVAD